MVDKLIITLQEDEPNIGGSAMLGLVVNNWVDNDYTLEEVIEMIVLAYKFYKDQR